MKKIKGFIIFVITVIGVLEYSLERTILAFFKKDKKDKDMCYRTPLIPRGKFMLWLHSSTLDWSGGEHLDPNKTYLVMPNHQSYTDILMILMSFTAFKRRVSFMSKKEVFYMPFMGSAMKGLSCIPVERGNARKAIKSINRTVEVLHSGIDVAIFPEGTRSANRVLLPFKKGAFLIARKANVEILPVAIIGTDICMPKTGIGMFPANMQLKVLKPIPTEGKKDEELMEEVRVSLLEGLKGNYNIEESKTEDKSSLEDK